MRAITATLAIFVLSCSDPVTIDPKTVCASAQSFSLAAGPNAVALKVGTTSDTGAFVALNPNDPLKRQFGSQGGSHVWGAALLYAPTTRPWVLTFRLTDASGAVAGTALVSVDSCGGGVAVVTGERIFLQFGEPAPDDAGAAHSELSLVASTMTGEPLSAEDHVAVQF